jgi:biotin transport system substrate-specific component
MNTLPATIGARLTRGAVLGNVLLVLAATAVIALAAQIAVPVPFTPVPLTLQPLAVLLVGAVLGSVRGAAAATLYLLEGMSGLPVFSQGHGGAMWLLGPTAGYLWSYPAAAFLSGWLAERGWTTTIARSITSMLIALAIIYLGGWSWLAIVSGPRGAFAMGVAPFVLADAVKIAIGATLLPYAQRLIGRM